jgi:hypothetical protein
MTDGATKTWPERSGWCDLAGVAASGACVVHCLAMPLVIAYLPLLGLSWLADHQFHQWMAAGCATMAFSAFVPGYRQHRRWWPFLVGATGTCLLTWAALTEPSGCCAACATNSWQEPCQTEAAPSTCCESALDKSVIDGQFGPAGTVLFDAAWLTPLGGCLLVVGHLANVHCRTCGATCSRHRSKDGSEENLA